MNEILHIFVGGQEFHKLQPSNCKGFKNTNLVISSIFEDFRSIPEVLFLTGFR